MCGVSWKRKTQYVQCFSRRKSQSDSLSLQLERRTRWNAGNVSPHCDEERPGHLSSRHAGPDAPPPPRINIKYDHSRCMIPRLHMGQEGSRACNPFINDVLLCLVCCWRADRKLHTSSPETSRRTVITCVLQKLPGRS